tara:strand:+ start:1741 stop:2352 length:612 start_codon:yes stop_codon:yes gene_type:complete
MINLNKQKISEEGLDLLVEGVNLGRPIPGQSLTNSKDEPYPWEKPAKYTNIKEALYEIFITLIDENVYPSVVRSLRKGVPIVDLASGVLMEGFKAGKFNPDLMLLLTEPVIYLFMVLAARSGIDNYRIDADRDSPNSDQNPEQTLNTLKSLLSIEGEKASQMKNSLESADMLPKEIEEELEEVDFPSLLAKVEKKQSLLGKKE